MKLKSKNNKIIDTHVTYLHQVNGLICIGKQIFPKPAKIIIRYSKSEDAEDTISFSDDESCMIHIRVDELKNILKEYKGTK